MLKTLNTLFIILLSLSTTAWGQDNPTCECIWQGPFTKAFKRADFIVSGEVINRKGNSLDLRIERTLLDNKKNGEEFNRDIRIWANNGKQCRPEVSRFDVGSQWLMALNKITEDVSDGFNPNTPNISYGRLNDYYLSKCGAYWLNLHDGFVTGNLINGKRWEWQNEEMNPVLIDLVKAYIDGVIPIEALTAAAKPQTAAKKLMQETQSFISTQTEPLP
jgi:hypothetical protein